jgi:hypothetical protein
VTQVEQVSETTFTFVGRYHVSLVPGGGEDSLLENVSNAVKASTARLAFGSSQYHLGVVLEGCEFFLLRDRRGLRNCE